MGPGTRRGAWRALRHRLRPWVARPLVAAARVVAPPLYGLYLRLVWATSRVEAGEVPARLRRVLAEHGGGVALMWHEEVMAAPFAYARLGLPGHAVVALGDGGDILAAIVRRCGHEVSRGGPSRRASRRNARLVGGLVERLRGAPARLCAFAVDGSRGPRYRLKRGGPWVARASGRPVVLLRLWYGRCLRLPTWDRFAVPLPGGEIRLSLRGPYPVPEDADSAEGLERFRRRLEAELAALAAESHRQLGQTPPAELPLEGPGCAPAAQDAAQEALPFHS